MWGHLHVTPYTPLLPETYLHDVAWWQGQASGGQPLGRLELALTLHRHARQQHRAPWPHGACSYGDMRTGQPCDDYLDAIRDDTFNLLCTVTSPGLGIMRQARFLACNCLHPLNLFLAWLSMRLLVTKGQGPQIWPLLAGAPDTPAPWCPRHYHDVRGG